jgi:TPR repeat protein
MLSIACLVAPAWADLKAGMDAANRGDYATALREWRPLAEEGNAGAQFNLGLHYYNGQGVPQDYVLARQWWEKAAAQAHVAAQLSLGTLYVYGYGVPKDNQQAIRWFRLAADQGDALAQVKLGVMYERGDGIPQDYVQAYKWYSLSGANGEKEAIKIRDVLAKRMTSAQIAEAQNLAREWKPKADMATALGQYNKAVGVFPKEFLRFSAIQQEAYLRGVLDGEYFLSEESKDPDRDAFVSCLNARLKMILSEAKSFVERKGEHNYLMPWTLGLLVGQSCPKETRAQDKTPPKYMEASTPTKLIFLQKENLIETEFQRQQAIIYKAFVRGVLDGKVYMLYGHRYSKLVDYLGCLSKAGNLDTIVLQRGAFTQFGENLDKSQAYGVAFTEALICKELNE